MTHKEIVMSFIVGANLHEYQCLDKVYFIAKQMGLKYPLLHVGSQKEIQIFQEFMTEHPNASAKTFDALAQLFKDKSDGKDIFPKLPTMLKSYYKTWEKNADIRNTEQSLNPSVQDLLLSLFNTRISSNTGELLPPTQIMLQQKDSDINVPHIEMNQFKNEEQHEQSDDDNDDNSDGYNDVSEDTNTPVIPPRISLYVPPMQAPVQQSYIPVHTPPREYPCQ